MLISILGMIIRNKRKKLNITLEELSDLTGISAAELSYIENGKIKAPSSVFLYRLSNALELDYNEMLNYKYASYYRLKELLNALDIIGDIRLDIDDFSNDNRKIYDYEEEEYKDVKAYRLLGLLAIALIDLGLIEIPEES